MKRETHSAQPQPVYRKAYQPLGWMLPKVELSFHLEPEETKVQARLHFTRDADVTPASPLVLRGVDLDTKSLAIDGKELAPDAYRISDTVLTLLNPPEDFILETDVVINPAANQRLMGLYRSEGLYCTQCEAEGFRSITWHPDRPDILSRYIVTINADIHDAPVLLSNGNEISHKKLENGRHIKTFEDPHPKPCYLFALVAGKLEALEQQFKTRSGRDVSLAIWCAPGQTHLARHAMTSLVKSMKWDEDRYGLEYDLDQFHIVAVADFNFGAMENKGLNIFNAKYILADPSLSTDADYEAVEAVVAHEYFHNWTGNRITLRDWFQLSLKEGLTVFRDQSFSADMRDPDVVRIDQVRNLRTLQFPEDAGPLAHPVRPDSYIEINNFYTLTIYEKGAELVRMLHTFLGEKGFLKGIDLYVERFDGKAATCDDFIAAMADANAADLRQFSLWYSETGTPTLRASTNYDADQQALTLTLSQSCPGLPQGTGFDALMIPLRVGLLDPSGKPCSPKAALASDAESGNIITQVDHDYLISLTRPTGSFTFSPVPDGTILSLNRGFQAPIRVEAAYTPEQLLFLYRYDTDPVVRHEAMENTIADLILGANRPDESGTATDLPLDDLISACTDILNDRSLSDLLKARLLSFPGVRDLVERQSVIQVKPVFDSLRQVRRKFADSSYDQLLQHYQTLNAAHDDPVVSAAAIGRRALKGLILSFLAERTDDSHITNLVAQQYQKAPTMTERLGALSEMIRHDHPDCQSALKSYVSQFHDSHTAMDKWFSLQASLSHRGLETVHDLMKHPAYDPRNPNRLRAVLGAFSMNNLLSFHAADGSAYLFLLDQILEVDKANPMMSARLAGTLAQWRRLEGKQKTVMYEALEQLAAHPGLSADCYEIARKSLGSSK